MRARPPKNRAPGTSSAPTSYSNDRPRCRCDAMATPTRPCCPPPRCSRDGVRKGQAVIAGEVLVGRIAEVGQRSARVLLLTDINSHIPVVLEGFAGQVDPDRRQYRPAAAQLPVVQHQRGPRRSRREFGPWRRFSAGSADRRRVLGAGRDRAGRAFSLTAISSNM